jgi:penicillin-binding protein 1A
VAIKHREQKTRTGSPSTPKNRRLRIGIVALGLLLIPFLPAAGLLRYAYFDGSDLPDLEPFIRFELPTTGWVLDSRGVVLIELAQEYRRVVVYDELPAIVRNAILAAEDKDFFSHSGVDYGSLPRVIQKSVLSSVAMWWKGDEPMRLRLPQGGSTITQQLVRGYFLRQRTREEDGQVLFYGGASAWTISKALGVPTTNKLLRKLEEVRLSLWLEREMARRYGSREMGKREIFSRYANFIYLGHGRYGFAAASDYYFDRDISTFTPADAGNAALLAGIGKSPLAYAPVSGSPGPLRRRNEILVLMARNGYIPADLAARASAEPVLVASVSSIKTDTPAGIAGVLAEMRRYGGDRFGVEDLFLGRVSVHATLDHRVQTIVNEALETGLARYEARHATEKGLVQGSVVVLRNRDAAILAEAGGRRVYRGVQSAYSDYNRVTESMRQPGSAFKPIVYLAAFRQGLGLDSTVIDEPIQVADGEEEKWISNYDGRFLGPIPARRALAESRNTAAVRLANAVGMNQMLRVARELGITSPLQRYVSTALGSSELRLLELAGAYRAIASGILAEPHVLEQVTDASGNVLYRAPGPTGSVNPTGLREIQEGLRGVVRVPGGTAHALDRRDFPIPVMGKTGTTNDFRDALFIGSTYGPQGITVAVRIGYDDGRSLGAQETGGRTALPIFREIMLRVYADELVGPVPRFPEDLEAAIDRYLATPVEPLAPQHPSLAIPPIRPLHGPPGLAPSSDCCDSASWQ